MSWLKPGSSEEKKKRGSVFDSTINRLKLASVGVDPDQFNLEGGDADSYVKQLILKEAQLKAKQYTNLGTQVYMDSNWGATKVKRTADKGFLSRVVGHTTSHNRALVKLEERKREAESNKGGKSYERRSAYEDDFISQPTSTKPRYNEPTGERFLSNSSKERNEISYCQTPSPTEDLSSKKRGTVPTDVLYRYFRKAGTTEAKPTTKATPDDSDDPSPQPKDSSRNKKYKGEESIKSDDYCNTSDEDSQGTKKHKKAKKSKKEKKAKKEKKSKKEAKVIREWDLHKVGPDWE